MFFFSPQLVGGSLAFERAPFGANKKLLELFSFASFWRLLCINELLQVNQVITQRERIEMEMIKVVGGANFYRAKRGEAKLARSH